MPEPDDLLRAYDEAAGMPEAEAALDALAATHAGDAGLHLGDRYDALAGAAATGGQYGDAARLMRKAVEHGCRNPHVARMSLGWYLIRSGSFDEGEAAFDDLRADRPDDPQVLLTLAHARSDAGLTEDALAAFDEAVAVARAGDDPVALDRARAERRAERADAGLAPDADDLAAPDFPAPLLDESSGGDRALAWFPPDTRAAVRERWPGLDAALGEPESHARRLETQMRGIQLGSGRRPRLVPVDLEELLEWADAAGRDPGEPATHGAYAAEAADLGDAIAWPPGRNDPCWCRSGRKYKRCCGAI